METKPSGMAFPVVMAEAVTVNRNPRKHREALFAVFSFWGRLGLPHARPAQAEWTGCNSDFAHDLAVCNGCKG
jgi:hypothetical protein